MSSSKKQILLTLIIDKNKHKVLYAEAGKDFVDVLLSFLTLPLGTVSRLVSEESTVAVQPCRFNCITSLRQSVQKLDPKCFYANWDIEMLLNPRNPMDDYYKNIFGRPSYDNTPFSKGSKGYVREMTCYIVSDDLRVMISDMKTTLWILQNFGNECVNERLRFTLNITQKELWDLLKFSLWSKTPLTDLFVRKELNIQNSETQVIMPKLKINEVEGKVGIRMKLKVLISKSERKVLFAEAEEDFIDQLFSFLTITVAAVQRLERGNTGLGCIDNLYQNSVDWNETIVLDSSIHDLKNNLLNPLIAATKVRNQLLPVYSLASSTGKNIGGYVKSGQKFMVTDDLCVEPFSSPSALSFVVESKVAEGDLEVMDLSIGVNEVFGILKAAMLSTSALTIGLRPLLIVLKEDKC